MDGSNVYTIALICAPKVWTAVGYLLEATHNTQHPIEDPSFKNICFGKIGSHNIIAVSWPDEEAGITRSKLIASEILQNFRSVRFVLLVTTGSGIPKPGKHSQVRLGDVVVSSPKHTFGGIVQFSIGLETGQPETIGSSYKPATRLLTALAALKSHHMLHDNRMAQYVAKIQASDDAQYRFPGRDADEMEEFDNHCETASVIHYGTIASGDQLVNDIRVRDQIRDKFQAKCIEMESAGAAAESNCLVICGIRDYADGSATKVQWEGYAAAAAAGFATEFLSNF
jgi:nucleoside phosphorylase